jgi:hypothetical protein
MDMAFSLALVEVSINHAAVAFAFQPQGAFHTMLDLRPANRRVPQYSPQGLKPTLLFSDVFGTTEVVPCYKTCIGGASPANRRRPADGLKSDRRCFAALNTTACCWWY